MPSYTEANIMPKVKSVATKSPANSIIHVDRTARPVYPNWAKLVMHPDLELLGPTEFDVAALELWLHDKQKGGFVRGFTIYDHLKDKGELSSCLGLRDLEEIQKKGIAFFRKYFGGKVVFGWKSVVRDDSGSPLVPYLFGRGVVVVLGWDLLVFSWYGDSPALRFVS